MRLEGSLDAFSLPDIFSLLSMTKKTGGLHLRRADAHGAVWLADGQLTGHVRVRLEKLPARVPHHRQRVAERAPLYQRNPWSDPALLSLSPSYPNTLFLDGDSHLG